MKTKKVKDGICTHQEGDKTVTHYAFEHAASHTPGPWKVYTRPNDGVGRHDVVDYFVETSDGLPVIAQVVEQYRGVTGANARLIAAAPSLLEALKDLVARFPEGSYEGAFSANARRVIAKAEGR